MENIIVGLAGHIDHGKTAFIKALNNFDGDERADEKARQITLDLSFSNLIINDKNIAFIDVPGHEKLVKNMIAGAFGFDILALIVALDDGIMPQTLEHIHIAHFLGIKKILVFLTKRDLVDESRVKLVRSEIIALLNKMDFELLEIVEFSIFDLDSIARAKNILGSLIKANRANGSFFRMYCDRTFHKKGFGVIVTGTILGEEIKVGDKVFLTDISRELIVKNIQNHDKSADRALPSQRAALNLSNLNLNEISRGSLLSKKGILRAFKHIDCVIFPLDSIKNAQNLTFFIGTKRLSASVNILEIIDEKIYATLRLSEPVCAVFKERFILRDNARTIAGGMVLNPVSDPMRKSQKMQYLKSLTNKDFKSAFEILSNAHKTGFGLIQARQRFDMSHESALEIAREIDEIFLDEDELVLYHISAKEIILRTILDLIKKNKNAIFSANSVKIQLKWSSINFINLVLDELEKQKIIKKSDKNIYLSANSEVKNVFDFAKDSILKELESAGMTPDSPYNIYDKLSIDRKLGDEVFKNLTRTRKVVRLSHNLFVLASELNKIMESLRAIIKSEGFIDVSVFKRHFNISRKYIICYLDYLDLFGDIEKIDNKRILK